MTDFTLEEAALLTAGATMWTTAAIDAHDIPSVRMGDGPMGVASARVDEREVSVLTPAPVSLGASWDPALVERIGHLVGGDAVSRQIDLMLAPNLNLARSPLAGRAFEYFSEDPLLTGVLGASWIAGLQSQGVGSVAKHLVCNDSETDRDSMNAVVDERTLREVYLLPFEFAARAGCGGMLTAYNRLNGSWCSESGHVISRIAKDEWGFPGVFMSDWFGTHSTLGSLGGGLDLEMPGPPRFLGPKTVDAVGAGAIAEDRIRDAAERVATAARRFSAHKGEPMSPTDSEALLIEAAAAGFTLVRNEEAILPLVPGRHRRIAIIGPNATAPCFQGGTFAKIALRPDAPSPLDAIRERYEDHCEIVHEPGLDPQPRLPRMPVRPLLDLDDGYTTGMTIEYFESLDAAEPVRAETRDTNSLTWFFGVHPEGAFQTSARTRARGIFTASERGAHRFYVGGTGAVRLAIDGETIVRRDEPVPASDVMGKLKSGVADHAEVQLELGQSVEVEVELRYDAARVQGLWYGVRGPSTEAEMVERAVAAARDADVVVLMVGETSDASVESKDRADTWLERKQIELIERVTEANPRTIVLVNVGHAVDTSWEASAKALMFVWYPGEAFGRALAQVLAGDREPGGRMPMTIAHADTDYPAFDPRPEPNGDLRYAEGVRVGYRAFGTDRPARHAFGSGFGYAAFRFADPAISDGGDALRMSITVRNLSDRTGSEVVQVYRRSSEFALVGFAKIEIAAGSEVRVSIEIPKRRLMSWSDGWHPIADLGELTVGRSSTDTALMVSLPSTWKAGLGDRSDDRGTTLLPL